ncbi:hypothetical protein FACS189499_01120 [Clostridia bacterium]|nr:hypothetical protein FACS189499_01120 [Clostridia bacterium]
MKALILFYSLDGNSRRHATKISYKNTGKTIEITERKKRTKASAFTSGVIAAMKGASTEICPIHEEFSAYESVVVIGPVWAGQPAPAVNSIIEAIPAGTKIYLYLVSKSGQADLTKITGRVKARGLELIGSKVVAEANDPVLVLPE